MSGSSKCATHGTATPTEAYGALSGAVPVPAVVAENDGIRSSLPPGRERSHSWCAREEKPDQPALSRVGAPPPARQHRFSRIYRSGRGLSRARKLAQIGAPSLYSADRERLGTGPNASA